MDEIVKSCWWMGSLIRIYNKCRMRFWVVWRTKSRPKARDRISRFSRTQVDDVYGKLSRESKLIFSTTWEPLSCSGSEIRRKHAVVKTIYLLKFVGGAKFFFLRLSPYKPARRELTSSQRELSTFVVSLRLSEFISD